MSSEIGTGGKELVGQFASYIDPTKSTNIPGRMNRARGKRKKAHTHTHAHETDMSHAEMAVVVVAVIREIVQFILPSVHYTPDTHLFQLL